MNRFLTIFFLLVIHQVPSSSLLTKLQIPVVYNKHRRLVGLSRGIKAVAPEEAAAIKVDSTVATTDLQSGLLTNLQARLLLISISAMYGTNNSIIKVSDYNQ